MKLPLLLCMLLACCAVAAAQGGASVEVWMSSENGDYALSQMPGIPLEAATNEAGIVIDPRKTCQTILGMGASFDHASWYNWSLLDEAARAEVIRKLFDPDAGIGMNLMRLCIGTSDFAGEPWYSYDDMPEGETDLELDHFSIDKDRAYLLPAVKAAQAANPDLLFFASPWSPPGWMKTTGTRLAGKLKPEYYGVYARYLLRFLRAYENEGVPIHALTLQNEPAHIDPAYPTCLWKGEEQRDLIRDHVGPLFAGENIIAKLWCWDHNYNRLEFPRAVLSDPAAAQYVDGTAFHFYEGEVEAMSQLRGEFPDKHLYFTEGSTFRTRGAIQLIGILRNWARSYSAWVIMLDENRKPNNGPHFASRTCLEFDSKTRQVAYRFDYYMYGQFMKFIHRGAVRVESTPGTAKFDHIALRNPDGALVMVAANAGNAPQTFRARCGKTEFAASLPARSVATFRWMP